MRRIIKRPPPKPPVPPKPENPVVKVEIPKEEKYKIIVTFDDDETEK